MLVRPDHPRILQLLLSWSRVPTVMCLPARGDQHPHLGLTDRALVQGRRADAFRLLVSPQLRGEGNWPKPALYSHTEARIFFSCDAALTALPFWRKVGPRTTLSRPLSRPLGRDAESALSITVVGVSGVRRRVTLQAEPSLCRLPAS